MFLRVLSKFIDILTSHMYNEPSCLFWCFPITNRFMFELNKTITRAQVLAPFKTKRPYMCESANNVMKSPSEISSLEVVLRVEEFQSQHESPCICRQNTTGWRCLHGRFQCFYTLFDFENVDSDNSDKTNKHILTTRSQATSLISS